MSTPTCSACQETPKLICLAKGEIAYESEIIVVRSRRKRAVAIGLRVSLLCAQQLLTHGFCRQAVRSHSAVLMPRQSHVLSAMKRSSHDFCAIDNFTSWANSSSQTKRHRNSSWVYFGGGTPNLASVRCLGRDPRQLLARLAVRSCRALNFSSQERYDYLPFASIAFQ
jgi:hypothetical protein